MLTIKNCLQCHQLGDKATREIRPETAHLGTFNSSLELWDRRTKSGPAGGPNRCHGLVVYPLTADGVVMFLSGAVEVHGEGEEGGGGEPRKHLLEFEGVGAEIEIPLPGDDAGDDFHDLRVQQRLSAGNRYERRSALVDGCEALLWREV